MQVIGGYDKDFKSRDPWKNLTELLWDKGSKNWPKEERISSNSQRVVIDGVVIDMREQDEYNEPEQLGRKVDRPAEDAVREAGLHHSQQRVSER